MSSGNAIYLLVVDMSDKIDTQKKRIEYWFRYLKSKLKSLDDASIIIVGNKSDVVSKDIIEQYKHHFTELSSVLPILYKIVAAKKSEQIEPVIELIQEQCSKYHSQKKFEIPSIYKLFGERIKYLRNQGTILLGTI